MEKHIVKRLLCGLLAFVLVLGYFPVPALAEEETSAPEETLSPETLPETLPETVPQTTPETLPETVPQTVPETVPETAPETVPEALLSDYTAEDVMAYSVLSSGSCGDNLTYTLTDDGVLTISGSGAMTDYPSEGAPWYSARP